GTIGNFATFDFIDLAAAAFSSAGTVSLAAGNVLKVSENGTTYSLKLDPAQSFAGATFHLASDGAGGTDITVGSGPAFGVTTPLMTNTGGDFDFDQVVGGQMVYTRLGGLGPEWEFGGNGFLLGDGNARFPHSQHRQCGAGGALCRRGGGRVGGLHRDRRARQR